MPIPIYMPKSSTWILNEKKAKKESEKAPLEKASISLDIECFAPISQLVVSYL